MLLAWFAGCGDTGGRVPVQGRVTWDGQPLDQGEIIFIPIQGTTGPTVAGPITNGQFSIPAKKGAKPGRYRVEITADRKTGRKIQADEGSSELGDEREQYLPARYNDDSELIAEIKDGKDGLEFKLTSR